MKQIFTLLIIFFTGVSQAAAQSPSSEEIAVKAAITALFDGMRTSDSTLIRKAFAPKSVMQTIATARDGKASVRSESVDSFIKSVTAPHPEKYDERIVFNFSRVMTAGRLFISLIRGGKRDVIELGVGSFELGVWSLEFGVGECLRDG